MEELASQGFVVLGVDQPYMGQVALPDGRVTEPTEAQFTSPDEIDAYYGADLLFVLNQLAMRDSADPDGRWTHRLDLDRIGAVGHSSGFVTVRSACTQDRRFHACGNIDAPGVPAKELAHLGQPLLWLRLDKAAPPPKDFLAVAVAPVYEAIVAGANHGSVTDEDVLSATTAQERTVAQDRLHAIEASIVAFFEEQLLGHHSLLLDGSRSIAGVTIHTIRPPR